MEFSNCLQGILFRYDDRSVAYSINFHILTRRNPWDNDLNVNLGFNFEQKGGGPLVFMINRAVTFHSLAFSGDKDLARTAGGGIGGGLADTSAIGTRVARHIRQPVNRDGVSSGTGYQQQSSQICTFHNNHHVNNTITDTYTTLVKYF